jgi:hypothetical protein
MTTLPTQGSPIGYSIVLFVMGKLALVQREDGNADGCCRTGTLAAARIEGTGQRLGEHRRVQFGGIADG